MKLLMAEAHRWSVRGGWVGGLALGRGRRGRANACRCSQEGISSSAFLNARMYVVSADGGERKTSRVVVVAVVVETVHQHVAVAALVAIVSEGPTISGLRRRLGG